VQVYPSLTLLLNGTSGNIIHRSELLVLTTNLPPSIDELATPMYLGPSQRTNNQSHQAYSQSHPQANLTTAA